MKTPLCNRCELHNSRKRIIVKLDGWANERKIYLCANCYYKIIKELDIGSEE
jgi:transposase-like protein